MRLEYVADPPPFTDPEEKEIVDRVRKRRGERGLISLDRTLLHSPPVANGWNTFLGAIRTGTSLHPSIKEAAISRVAILNKAWYEFEHHAPLLLKDGGMSVAGLKHILTTPASTKFEVSEASSFPKNDAVGIDDKHAAVIEYTDWMTLECEVPEQVFERLRKVFSEREVVEVTATVGAYNCVSRFLVALNVSERNGPDGMKEALKHVSPELEGLTPASR